MSIYGSSRRSGSTCRPMSNKHSRRPVADGTEPLLKERMMNDSNDWLRVCAIDDIPVLGARVVQRSHGAPVALFRNAADGVFALLDRCPHQGGPLSQGIVHGERVACPLHGWNVDLTCGGAIAPDEGCTPAFA